MKIAYDTAKEETTCLKCNQVFLSPDKTRIRYCQDCRYVVNMTKSPRDPCFSGTHQRKSNTPLL